MKAIALGFFRCVGFIFGSTKRVLQKARKLSPKKVIVEGEGTLRREKAYVL
jgi:hypothetical protein